MNWTIELPGRPPTVNAERKGTRAWHETRALTRQWRFAASMIWRDRSRHGHPKHLDAISITARQLSKDRRWLQDLGACMPAVKAAIDGLVDAGLIDDDTSTHVVGLTFLPPLVVGRDGLQLTITPATQEVAA